MRRFRRFMRRNAGNFSTAYALGRIGAYTLVGAAIGLGAGYVGGEFFQYLENNSLNYPLEWGNELGTFVKIVTPIGVGAGAGAKAISEAPQIRENVYHGIRRTF